MKGNYEFARNHYVVPGACKDTLIICWRDMDVGYIAQSQQTDKCDVSFNNAFVKDAFNISGIASMYEAQDYAFEILGERDDELRAIYDAGEWRK